MQIEKFSYDNQIVKQFIIASVVFAIIGMLVGLVIAVELYLPELNLGLSYITFGRIRPLHTNAVIFAFVGNIIFAGVYYSLQRVCKARMYNDFLSQFHFWGWQFIIVAAAVSLPMGITTSKEYAELEWPIDLMIAIVWLVFGTNLFGTIIKRREKHIYVAVWFYIATFVTITVLHVVNSIEIPVSFLKSYPVYAGVQDALVQWWYGHNAVAFFLTTPYLGLMYYFLPKAANRPVYSYRLSILHFWALIFLYIWAGPHHLLYSSLPDWAQSLGTVFSIMLIAPSWGGMINGLLTLRGAWDRVRDNPILKFMVVAVTAYGMATFEGPMLSLKNVNAISHFTDWTLAHVHVGALGWNGMMSFGILYWMIPKMWGTELYSKKIANLHFWLSTLGIVFWVVPMYWSGIAQALMWKQFTPLGILQYPNFLETTLQIIPFYIIRSFGGLLYFLGLILLVYNLIMTAKTGSFIKNEDAEAAPLEKINDKLQRGHFHRWLESRPGKFAILSLVVILIGGMVQIIPMLVIKTNVPTIANVKPYTPLEVHGRDIYIKEGCVSCHSQLVRPFRSETERYGEYSKSGEYVYDHPFLWGSKRTGPDLMRLGGKYGNLWHYLHMEDPRSMSPGSIMPRYPWLYINNIDVESTPSKIRALRAIGVPYPEDYENKAIDDLRKQANTIAEDIQKNGVSADPDKEIIALIAYLQRLGTDIKVNNTGDK